MLGEILVHVVSLGTREDREETESCSLRSHRPEFGATRAAGNLGGKTKMEGATKGEVMYKLYSNLWLTPKLCEWRDSKEIRGK